MAIIPSNAFPQIDNSANIITGQAADENEPLLQLASQMLPGRFVVQFNFLMAGSNASPAVMAAAQNCGTLPAFQVNNWYGGSGGGSGCGGSPASPTPRDDASYLNMLETGIYPLGITNSLRAQYIEIFATNANAMLPSNAIWQAHRELFAGP